MLIPREVFAMAEVCDPDSTRYALGAVQFRRSRTGQPLAAASNGSVIVGATWQEPQAENPFPPEFHKEEPEGEILVSADACRDAARLGKGKRRNGVSPFVGLSETAAEGRVSLASRGTAGVVRQEVEAVVGKFPTTADLLTGSPESISVRVDPARLAQLLEICRMFTSDERRTVTLTVSTRPGGPLWVRGENDESRAVGVMLTLGEDERGNVAQPPGQWPA